jgi:type II secretory pathway component PulF
MRRKRLAVSYRSLSQLLEAGLSLPEALSVLASRGSAEPFGGSVSRVVSNGGSLSEALQSSQVSVPPAHHGVLQAGEASGRLSEALDRLSDRLSRDDRTVSKVAAVSAYPMLILLLLAAASVLFSRWVLPTVAALAAVMDPDGAAEIRAAAWRVGLLPVAGAGVAGGAAGIGLAWYHLARAEGELSVRLDRALLSVPVLGGALSAYRLSVVLFVVETLLAGGASLEDAFDGGGGAASGSVRGAAWVEGCRGTARRLRNGESFTAALEAVGVFPELVLERATAVDAGASARLVAGELRHYYEEDLDRRLEAIARGAEPVMIGVTGLVFAAFVALSVFPLLRAYGALLS